MRDKSKKEIKIKFLRSRKSMKSCNMKKEMQNFRAI